MHEGIHNISVEQNFQTQIAAIRDIGPQAVGHVAAVGCENGADAVVVFQVKKAHVGVQPVLESTPQTHIHIKSRFIF